MLAALSFAALAFAGNDGDATKCPLAKQDAPTAHEQARADRRHATQTTGKSPAHISAKLNAKLSSSVREQKACDAFTPHELDALFRTLWCYKSDALGASYAPNDGRALLHNSLDAYEKRWSSEYTAAAKDAVANRPTAISGHRDGKCAHVLMMYTHHITDSAKAELKKATPTLTIPTLPTYDASAHKVAASSFTCVTGHNQTAGHTTDHVWPHWPAEVHYHGMGHGAYPFWMGGEGEGTSASTWWPGGPIEVWWSETKASEKFYHQTCYTTELGYSSNVPCYHLFKYAQPSPVAYMYTASEDFCCVSGPSATTNLGKQRSFSVRAGGPGGNTELLTSPQGDFMDLMTLNKNYKTHKGTFYEGTVNKYSMQLGSGEPVTNFWYVTTPEGLPVEQGEGGSGEICEYGTNCETGFGGGIYLYHEYNTSSFKSVTLDDDVFKIPDICLTTTNSCTFP